MEARTKPSGTRHEFENVPVRIECFPEKKRNIEDGIHIQVIDIGDTIEIDCFQCCFLLCVS